MVATRMQASASHVRTSGSASRRKAAVRVAVSANGPDVGRRNALLAGEISPRPTTPGTSESLHASRYYPPILYCLNTPSDKQDQPAHGVNPVPGPACATITNLPSSFAAQHLKTAFISLINLVRSRIPQKIADLCKTIQQGGVGPGAVRRCVVRHQCELCSADPRTLSQTINMRDEILLHHYAHDFRLHLNFFALLHPRHDLGPSSTWGQPCVGDCSARASIQKITVQQRSPLKYHAAQVAL